MMRILFAGNPAIVVPCLEILTKIEGIELVGVLTNPDTPKGRTGTPFPTEIGIAAEKIIKQFDEQGRKSFPILKPSKLDAQLRNAITLLKPDLLVSFAYGHIFGPKFLALFPLGGINVHPSLLPKYRGPTPIQSAILNRDTVTGITIQKLALEVDSGDILDVQYLQLTGEETAFSLSNIIAHKAAEMLPSVLKKIAAGEQGTPQDHSKASFCPLISKDDSHIDWSTGAQEIEAKIRAYDPWPLCRAFHNGRQLTILKAQVLYQENAGLNTEIKPGLVLGTDNKYGILIQTGEGILAVTQLQYSGKKALFWKDFLNGARDFIGAILS